MLDWVELQTFLAVSEAGSFAKAAETLGVSQPTVSRRIEHLEIRFGEPVFRRVHQGVVLTEMGREVQDRAAIMGRSAEALEGFVRSRKKSVQGRFVMACTDGLTAFWITPHMRSFLQANPQLLLSVDCEFDPAKPLAGATDLALTMSEPTDPDLIRVPLCWLHYAFFASPIYVNVYGAPSSPAEIPAHRTVLHSSHALQKKNWARSTDPVQELSAGELLTNSSAVSLFAIVNGIGIGAAPTAVSAVYPDLVCLPFGSAASVRLWMTWRKGAELSPAFHAVRSWLESIFDPRQYLWFAEDFIEPSKFLLEHADDLPDITDIPGQVLKSA